MLKSKESNQEDYDYLEVTMVFFLVTTSLGNTFQLLSSANWENQY